MSISKTSPSEIRRSKLSRRQFGKTTSKSVFGAALGFQFIPSRAWGKLEKPTLAAIGVGGKGRADINGSLESGFDLVALVDVVNAHKASSLTGRRLKSTIEMQGRFPKAQFFSDYRQMIAQLEDKIDAVTISTPDHHHCHAAVLAMQAGMHVYCQKPLAHSLWEARMMANVAEQSGVKTQMGNQAHANDHLRRCVELIRAGIIGKVKEVHAWTNRPIWPQGFSAPPPREEVPAGIDWQQWIGPAPWVDYSSKIAPFAWRGWWDYGTGALGDMACHIMDMPYWALSPGAPKAVTAKQHGATDLSPPINSEITWEFGPNAHTSEDGFRYHWYDGYVDARFDRDRWILAKGSNQFNHPSAEVLDGLDFRNFGSVIVGDQGKLFFHRKRNNWIVRSSNKIDGFVWPPKSVPRARNNHNYREWFDAISGKIPESESNFSLAGPLTETVLLGVLAQRASGARLEWNAETLEVVDRPDLQKFIRREYRAGWELEI